MPPAALTAFLKRSIEVTSHGKVDAFETLGISVARPCLKWRQSSGVGGVIFLNFQILNDTENRVDAMGRLILWRAAPRHARARSRPGSASTTNWPTPRSSHRGPTWSSTWSAAWSLSLEASSPASDGSYERKDPPAECDRRAPDLTLLRWLEGPRPRARLPLEPQPLRSHTSHWLSL